MISSQSLRIAEACRFCWMCRHLCPVGLATGKECNTPRAKGLLVSLESRGTPPNADSAEIMYECVLCGACTNDCVTGYEPPVYIREARMQSVVDGTAPEAAMKVIDKILSTGNMYGETKPAIDLSGIPEKADVLVYLGNTARYRTPDIANALLSLLRKAGINFAVLHDEPGSGIELFDMMGQTEEARQIGIRCAERIHESGAKELVLLDSYDAAAFLHTWPDWGIALSPKVTTATAYVDQLVKSGKLKVTKTDDSPVTYHDGSRLARDLDEHAPARDLLAALGHPLAEMFQHERLAKCCGSALFGQYAPDLLQKTAEGRWQDASRTRATVMVSACPQSYYALSQAIPEGYTLADLFVLLDSAT